MNYTDTIITKAREELKGFIKREVELLRSALGIEEDAEGIFTIDATDLGGSFRYDVEVEDCEGNEYNEKRKLDIIYYEDGDITLGDEEEEETDIDEFDTDTMKRFADYLVKNYEVMVK